MAHQPIHVVINDNHATVNGIAVEPRAGQNLREAAIHYVAREHAQPAREPVRTTADDGRGIVELLVNPDGTTTGYNLLSENDGALESLVGAEQSEKSGTASQPGGGPGEFSGGATFLTTPEETFPTPTGWRGILHALGFPQQPTEADKRARAEARAVSQHWSTPRSVAIVNGKGGSGKTPTTALLAAVFARAGGSGVLAWDCNLTRGTLGWRTEQAGHDSTIHDLVPRTQDLLSAGARAADLAAYVHHQTDDRYDVLRSNPLLLSTDQKITADQMDDVHTALAKYYRLIFMDSGNDEGDEQWLRMIDHADQLVIPTTTRPDHAEAARLLLAALAERDSHSMHLARNAIVIVSQADREERQAATIAQTFDALGLTAVTIPYDPAMRKQWIRHDSLALPTREAFRRAAAEVARHL